MENSTQAIYMAASVLVAVMIMSLIVFLFNNISDIKDQEEKDAYANDIAAFNKEYEAFKSNVMYGYKVITCINKAVDNNNKSNDAGDGLVQVVVKLKTDLKESLEFYHIKNGKKVKIYDSADSYFGNNIKFKNIFKDYIVSDSYSFETNYSPNDYLKKVNTTNNTHKLDSKELKLLNESSTNNANYKNKYKKNDISTENVLYKLSKLSDKEIVRDNNGWVDETGQKILSTTLSSVKWTTVGADFLKRKFKCTSIDYNENTGYVDTIVFEER